MDKGWAAALAVEALALGVALDTGQLEALERYAELLLRWNAKVNLTRITEPGAVRVKHLVDSLAALRVVPAGRLAVLDLGTGAGLPGIPWLIARPELAVTLVDSVAKKVGFLKTALAQLGLSGGRAIHCRLGGQPGAEGLAQADVVVSRAFSGLAEVLTFARPYLKATGAVVAMLGDREGAAEAYRIASDRDYALAEVVEFDLPAGMGHRLVARAVPRGTQSPIAPAG